MKYKKNHLPVSLFVILSLICCSFMKSREAADHKYRLVATAEIKELFWLIGNWQNNAADGSTFESWQLKNDSVLTGTSCFIKGNDTLSSEKISIEQHGPDLFYIPVVSEQNDGRPVVFKLTAVENKSFVFENPAHDFPQKITYHHLHSDSLLAEISGIVKGSMKVVKFPMQRNTK